MPTAGEIENQINRSLQGLKDIKTDVKVNMKVGKLGRIKSQLRKALGNERFNVKAGVKVTGMAELNRLATQIEKVRRLAKEPINMKVDTGIKGVDDAVRQAASSGQLMARTRASQHKEMLQQERQFQKEMRSLQTKLNRAEQGILKNPGSAQADIYRKDLQRIRQEQEELNREYRNWGARNGFSDNQIADRIIQARRKASEGQSSKLAKIDVSNQAKASAAAYRELTSAIKEADKAQTRMISAGPRERVALQQQTRALQQQIAAQRESARLSEQDLRRSRQLEANLNLRRNVAAARQADAARSKRRGGIRNGGVTPTANVWDMLQTGVYGAAAAIAQVNELDKAITKVTKVVPDSQRAVNRWKKNIFKDASEVGKTAPEFASAVEQWATAGYNLRQSNKLAKASVMGSFVGEVPVNDMVRYMSVPLKAFQKEGLKSKDIINAMNQVSNKHAIEMEDLGQAYQKASSTVGATGTKFSQLTGIITAAQEGTRAGGDMIGTAFKTIGSRLAKMGAGLTKQDKTRAAFFKGLGVDLTDSNGKLKSTWQIMDQLGKKWDHLDSKQKNTAAQYAAGANHANIFQATMDNWKTARKAMREAQAQVDLRDKDHGSAYQEFAKQKQSIQFQLAQLQNTWSEFLTNITGGREGITQMLGVLNQVGIVAAKLASNKGFSQMVRWGAVTAGIVLARRAMSSVMSSLLRLGSESSGIDKLRTSFSGLGSSVDNVKSKVDELKADIRSLDSMDNNDSFGRKKAKRKSERNIKGERKNQRTFSTGLGSYYYYDDIGEGASRRQKSRGKKQTFKLDRKYNTGKLRLAKKAVDDFNQSASQISPTMSRAEGGMSTLAKGLSESITTTSRFGRVIGIAGRAVGIAGKFVKGLGLAIDGATISMGVLEMLGVHPWELIQRAINPASYNAQKFNASMEKIHGNIQKIDSSLGSNVVFNGTAAKSQKGLSGLSKTLSSVAGGVNQLSSADWKKFKSNFDSISKANGLGIRASANNVELLKDQMVDLKSAVHDVDFRQFRSGVKDLSKLNKESSKLDWGKNSRKIVNSMKGYNDELNKLKNKEASESLSSGTNYKAKERALYNKYLRKARNTDQYQEWAQNYDDVGAAIRKRYGSLAKTLNSGVFGKSDYMRMSNNQLRTAQTAQTMNLQQAARASMIWKQANGVLKNNNKYAAQQGKLTKEQQLWLAKNVKGLEGISRNTKNWTDAQRKAFDDYEGVQRKQLANQKKRMRDILESEGMSKSSANKLIGKLDGTGLGYAKALAGVKDARALLNIDPDFYSQYGPKWYPQYLRQQKEIQNLSAKHPNNAAIQAFIDPDTGGLNTSMEARTQAIATQNGKIKKKFQGYGFINKNGDLNYGNIGRAFNGVRGADNPAELMEEIADGSINKKSNLHIQSNMSGGKLNSNVRKAIRDVVKNYGKADAKNYIDQLRKSGAISKSAAKKQKDYVDKDLSRRGNTRKNSKYYDSDKSSGKKPARKSTKSQDEKDLEKANKYWKDRGKSPARKWWDKLWNGTKSSKSNDRYKNLSKAQSSMIPTNLKNLGGKGSAWYALTHGTLAKNLNSTFGKIGNGFKKGGLFGGMFNMGKMAGNGLQKMLFGKKLNLGSMFKGRNNPFNGLKNAFRGKNNPFNGIRNMFKGKNNPFSGLKNMFSGKNNPLSKLFGGKGKKLKLQADTKGLSKSISKLGKGKGQKVKLQADTKALGKSLRSLGKGKGQKVKLQADTKALSKSISRLGKGKGQKVKLQADTKALSNSVKKLGKQKTKVKVTADVSGVKSKIKSATKGTKAKVKVTADVSSAKSKINSLKSSVKGIKSAKVKVTASVSGVGKVKALKSALNGLHNRSVTVTAVASGVGKVKSLKSAINGVHNKSVTVSASVSGTGKVRALRSAINGVHSKHVSVTAKVSGIGDVRSLASAIASVHSKSVTVSVTKTETTIKKTKNGSVAIDPTSANPLKSMSVVAQSPQLMGIVNASAANMGVDANSAMNGQKVTDYSDSTQDVSEDYWRYMGNQLYTGLPLDEQVNKLESAVTQADQDMDKLINLSRQRIDVDNKQIAYQKTMQNAYQQQINDMINQLHKYGFQNNGNQITNLIHAKDIHGDNASKVDDLLSKYQSAYQNFSEATQKIQELQTDIWQQGKNQEDYRNTKDQKMVEGLQRSLELLTTAIDNHKNILERKANSLSDEDYVMRTENSAEQIQVKSADINDLLKKFNELSVANFVGTKDADNAKNLLESLQSIRDAITENLDSIADLKKTMRDIQLSSIIENLSKYTDNLNNSIDRLKNNVTNLQDGLLSGTTYSDLISSNFDAVNLDQRTAYEKSVNDRISLEEELDKALDKFAQKNVDRTAQVANQELQINQQKYEELLKMRQAAEAHTIMTLVPIKTQYQAPSSGNVYQDELEKTSHNKEYLAASVEYQREMNELKDRYNDKMKNASSQAEKEAINQAMVFEQLALQEKVYNRMIAADQQAINELKKQAENPDMSTEQRKTISDQITEYENNIMEAQNNIKDAIKGRFEYEKQLLDKQMDEYKRASDTISNLVTIADALHLDGETQARVINQQYASTYREYENYLDVLARLRKELSSYEKGSFEYNQLSDMINDYQSTLDSTVTSLLDITKEEFSHTLDSIQDSFEKSVNDGMTANQAKFDQDVWYNPMQKELKLEEMRLKITELEDKTVEKRIAALDAQERMSKAEADYVDKQLDLALAEQKLNNTINKKDVRYLEKDENGKFNWTYIADQDSVDAARQEVNQAKQAIEDAKVSNRNDYIEKVEEVISGAKDGTLNQEEVRKRIEQLNNSYKFILKDIPTFDISKVEDIISAYDAYAEKNKDIIDQYKRSANVSNNAGYQEIVKGFGEQFKAVSKDLGEIFGKQLREALNLPDGIRNAYGNGSADKPVVIQKLNLELPNVHDANEFAEALKTLPQVAQQYASHK